MLTSTKHHHPYYEQIRKGYTLSLTQLFGFVYSATRAIFVVVLSLQQWLFNILPFHVSDITPPLVSLCSLFPTPFCMHQSFRPRKDYQKRCRVTAFVLKHKMEKRENKKQRPRKETYTKQKWNMNYEVSHDAFTTRVRSKVVDLSE